MKNFLETGKKKGHTLVVWVKHDDGDISLGHSYTCSREDVPKGAMATYRSIEKELDKLK